MSKSRCRVGGEEATQELKFYACYFALHSFRPHPFQVKFLGKPNAGEQREKKASTFLFDMVAACKSTMMKERTTEKWLRFSCAGFDKRRANIIWARKNDDFWEQNDDKRSDARMRTHKHKARCARFAQMAARRGGACRICFSAYMLHVVYILTQFLI